MHFNTQVKIVFLTLILLTFSACATAPMDYKSIAYNDALVAGIPPQYFVNQINAESRFNPDAYSSAGAIGIAQFEPETAAGLGIDPRDPIQSLQGAARLMASYQAKYGSYKMALVAYQCGPKCLQWSIDNCGYWWWCIPESTRQYINEVMPS